MSTLSPWHEHLGERGLPANEGKCSVPMWRGGMPAGFCDEPAFGTPLPRDKYRRDRYEGYVPALACPGHGGPARPEGTAALPGDP